ncbi:LegC family aminotransferase [Patescibacteria group bacterium]|nr:LegC family aminotransferase [Patescibacteria group bacterium]
MLNKPQSLEKLILGKLRAVLPDKNIVYALSEPKFNGRELSNLKQCLDTAWVSTGGEFIDEFEKKIARFTKIKYVTAVVNGTAALHVALLLINTKPGDEVLIPALTFVATANAISYLGAIPHFIDSEEKTLGVDPEKLKEYLKKNAVIRNNACYNKKTKRPIKALVPMHTFGHPVDLDPLKKICRNYRIILIEDAAEALGSFYKGKHVGHWGKLSILSFNGNKIITTGGGGAILTNNKNLAEQARHITTTAKVDHSWAYYHNRVGFNYRLPNLNAALGSAQIDQLPRFIKNKRKLARRYAQVFKTLKNQVQFFQEAEFSKSNYWLNAILLNPGEAKHRNKILNHTNRNNILTRPAWNLIHTLPMYRKCPRMEDLSCAKSLASRIINLPSSAFLYELSTKHA